MGFMRHQYNPKRHVLYTPVNIEKYIGNVPIVMRSKLELAFAMWLDKTPGVLQWSSENLAIPYLHPVKKDKIGNRKRVNYYPDFMVKINTKEGPKTLVIEIKCEKEASKPKPGNRKDVLAEQVTYMVNMSKWTACTKFCEEHGYTFKVVTDKEINQLR